MKKNKNKKQTEQRIRCRYVNIQQLIAASDVGACGMEGLPLGDQVLSVAATAVCTGLDILDRVRSEVSSTSTQNNLSIRIITLIFKLSIHLLYEVTLKFWPGLLRTSCSAMSSQVAVSTPSNVWA